MITLGELKQAREEAIDEMIGDMVEFGIDLKVAKKLAPIVLRYMVDPKGAKQALIDEEPNMAAILGWIVKH